MLVLDSKDFCDEEMPTRTLGNDMEMLMND
jgi:hypothetical protein